MPLRKHAKPPPRFTFVIPEFEGNQMRWLKTHSDATRSHAAYWSGPAKRQWQVGKERKQKQDNANVPKHDADERFESQGVESEGCDSEFSTTQSRRTTKRAKKKGLPLRQDDATPPHIAPMVTRYLSAITSEAKSTSSFSADVAALRFYNVEFVRRFVMVDNEDSAMMFSSCLMVGYAHYIALTGQGTTTTLLELKSQVIRYLTSKMNSPDALLSPRCLVAILALGAPIVCLVSRDFPRGLSIREYINVTLEEDYLCNEESAVVALSSYNEQRLHRQALRRLLLRTKTGFQDGDSIALLQYISNYMKLSIAIEAADYLHTPSADIETLFPVTGLSHDCPIAEQWISPLTLQWIDKTSTVHIEAQMLLLARLVHNWLATFSDDGKQGSGSTVEVLQMRANLRQQIESFTPAAKGQYEEADAMYECCRRATLVLLAAERLRIPNYAAAKHVETRPKITKLFRKTDLANLWGNHIGLLFWVAATCQFATAGHCFPLLCTTLLARLVQELSLSDLYTEVAIASLKRLKRFESSCCSVGIWSRNYCEQISSIGTGL